MNMAWLAVDKDGTECICNTEPYRDWVDFKWCIENLPESNAVKLPKGSIKKLIGKELSFADESVELKE